MRTFFASLAILATVTCGAFAQSKEKTLDPFAERFSEAEALRRGDGVPAAPERAFAIFEQLANEGSSRAQDRAAYALWRGIGTEKDIARAEDYYRQAIVGGHLKSMINLGRLLIDRGEGEAARSVLTDALAANIDSAKYWLARGDALASFGDASDQNAGSLALVELHFAGDDRASIILADLLQRGGSPLGYDPERAFSIYMQLAEKGSGTALYRVGYAYWRGIGTDADLNKAIEYFQYSYDAGRGHTLINLGRAYADANRPDDAFDALTRAYDAELNGAKYWLARGHYEVSFGDKSEENLGLPILLDLARTTSIDAALFLARRTGDRRITLDDYKSLIPPLTTASDNGDGNASAALVRLYRSKPRLDANPIDTRAALLKDKGEQIRPDLYLEEKVALVADTKRGSERNEEIAALLTEARGEAHLRGLLQAYREDKRIYTYVLQQELSERGFLSGQAPNGRMTGSTVAAFRNFCQKAGLDEICTHGPLRTDAVKAVSSVFGSEGPMVAAN